MEFPIKRGEHVTSNHSEEDKQLAYDFAAKVYRELDRFCRAIILFGSVTDKKGAAARPGDIDIMIILDDVQFQLSPELLTGYRVITENAIRDVSERLHVTTVNFTTFWEYVRVADPVMVNVLRSGQALIDTGFFEPMQHLLRQGRIKPTDEAIWAYYLRAPHTLHNSQGHLMQAVMDLYWAVIDASHAALMAAGQTPPSPSHVGELLRRTYVEKGLLEEEYVKTYEHFYAVSKDITHRRVSTISGEFYDDLYASAKHFVDRMRSFLPGHEPKTI